MSDFNWVPSYVFTETPEFKTLVSKYENGAEQRRAVRSAPIRSWQLVFSNVPKSVYQAINTFFLSKLGQLESFTWTNPNDNIEYTVRFAEDKINFERNAFNVYSFSLQLVGLII